MRNFKVLAAACVSLLLAGGAATAAPQKAETPKVRKICRTVEMSGRITPQRICRTVVERTPEEGQTQREARDSAEAPERSD